MHGQYQPTEEISYSSYFPNMDELNLENNMEDDRGLGYGFPGVGIGFFPPYLGYPGYGYPFYGYPDYYHRPRPYFHYGYHGYPAWYHGGGWQHVNR